MNLAAPSSPLPPDAVPHSAGPHPSPVTPPSQSPTMPPPATTRSVAPLSPRPTDGHALINPDLSDAQRALLSLVEATIREYPQFRDALRRVLGVK